MTREEQIIELYLQGYRNGCELSKVKLIEAACKWLENNMESYIGQIYSDVYYSDVYSNLVSNFKSYLMGVSVN
jgi:hypothetical protein